MVDVVGEKCEIGRGEVVEAGGTVSCAGAGVLKFGSGEGSRWCSGDVKMCCGYLRAKLWMVRLWFVTLAWKMGSHARTAIASTSLGSQAYEPIGSSFGPGLSRIHVVKGRTGLVSTVRLIAAGPFLGSARFRLATCTL